MRIKKRFGTNQPAKTVGIGIVGKISIGEKGEKGNPVSLDYFRCKANPEYQQMFRDKYGEKPNKLTIVFLSTNPDENCTNFYELRDSAGKRISYGDGEKFMVATMQQDRSVKDVEVIPADPDKWMEQQAQKSGTAWKECLILRFALPEMPVLGLWEFVTFGDDSTIPAILGSIDVVQSMAGRICLIPFDLSVKKVKSDKAGSKSVYPVVSLTCNLSAETAEKVRMLPASVGGILNENKVLQLSGGDYDPEKPTASVSAKVDDDGFDEYEEVPNPENEIALKEAKYWMEQADLITADDYTKAAWAVIRLTDQELQKQWVEKLADRAQLAGLFWDKTKKAYIAS